MGGIALHWNFGVDAQDWACYTSIRTAERSSFAASNGDDRASAFAEPRKGTCHGFLMVQPPIVMSLHANTGAVPGRGPFAGNPPQLFARNEFAKTATT